MTPLDRHIERLQAMRAACNGSSDFATDLLDVLDECKPFLSGEEQAARAWRDDLDKGVGDRLDEFVAPHGDSPILLALDWCEEIKGLVDAETFSDAQTEVSDLVDFRADLLVLLVEAGIAEPNIMPDDPIGILRMFLPAE